MKRLILFVLLLPGCEEYKESEVSMPPTKQPEFLLVFAVGHDFRDKIEKFEGPFKFLLSTSGNFFQQRLNSSDRIIITRLAEDAILWRGRPGDLSKKFRDGKGLAEFIGNNTSGEGSPYAGLAEILEYLQLHPGVQDGRTKVQVITLSSMRDSSKEGRDKLVKAMREFNGEILNYWIDWKVIKDIQEIALEAGRNKPEFEPIDDTVEGLTYEQ